MKKLKTYINRPCIINGMDPKYIQKVQEWIKYDNVLQRIKQETTDAANKKKEVEEEILTYVQENNLQSLNINVSDGSIKFSTVNSKSPLTMKTLKSLLEKYSTEKKVVINIDEIVKFINDNMESKAKSFIKRDIKINS